MSALRDFVADLMLAEGAAVEPTEPEGLDILAPEPVAKALGWPELARLGFAAELPAGAQPIGLEGDWLDRFGSLLGGRGRFAERQLVLPAEIAAPRDGERLIANVLQLPNATWRLKDVKPASTPLLLLAFRYTAVSDEKREGLVCLGFNCGTGAALDDDLTIRLRTALEAESAWPVARPELGHAASPSWPAAPLPERIKSLLELRVESEIEPFVRAMRRRLERDRARVHAYHDDLRRAAEAKLAALQAAAGDKAEADRKREAMRIAAIEREYAAKIADLKHNYALKVVVEWVQGLSILAPVQRHEVLIKRRKGERTILMDWHPAARRLEPPCDDWGHGRDAVRLVCDDRLHLTGPAGQAPCPSCGKAWCRACHPAACPRCGRPTESRGRHS